MTSSTLRRLSNAHEGGSPAVVVTWPVRTLGRAHGMEVTRLGAPLSRTHGTRYMMTRAAPIVRVSKRHDQYRWDGGCVRLQGRCARKHGGSCSGRARRLLFYAHRRSTDDGPLLGTACERDGCMTMQLDH